jgi:hypothetical protein
MAHRPEQHDDPEALDAIATDVLRSALAMPPTPTHEYTRRLRALLAPLCTVALRSGHQAEELVIRLKALWQTVGVTDDNPYGRRDAIFERVVSVCIEEYYRALDGPPA